MAFPAVARWSTPFQITNFFGGTFPAVSAVGGPDAGEFVVVWSQFGDPATLGDGSGFSLYGQLYNQDGSRQGGYFLVNGTTTSDQVDPVVYSRNSMPGFAVAWRDFSGTGGGTDPVLRLFNGSGGADTGDLLGTAGGPTQSGNQNQISMARGEMFGAEFVTWTDFAGAPNGDGLDIRGALFGNSAALGPDFRITTTATLPGETGFQAQSNVASLPQTGFVVTWADNVSSGSDVVGGGSKIRGQLYSFLGVPIGGQFDIASTGVLSTLNTFVQYPKSAGFSSSGIQFVTAWVQDDDTSSGTDFNVHARAFSISGSTAVGGADFLLSQSTAHQQSQVALASYGTDRFVAVWTDSLPFQAPEVRARMFMTDGTPVTDEFVVIPEDTQAASFAGQLASVAVLFDTINSHPIPRFVVTWNDNTGNMWGQIFSPAASELLGIDFFGSERGETYTAQYSEHVLAGNGGNDSLTGSALADNISGGNDNDTLNGLGGGDTLNGGEGDDRILAATADGNDTITGGNGFDVLDFSAVGGVVQVNQFAGTVTGSAGNDTLTDVIEQIIGSNFNDVLAGGNGINVLDGNGGDDQLFGNGGQDLLRGGDGNDTFYASVNDGNDTLLGGAGFDVLDYSTLPGVVQVNQFAGTTTGTANNDTLSDVFEQVIGSAFGDVLAGGNGINGLIGGGGNDSLFGNGGQDYLRGGTGNDEITMGTGDDTLDMRVGDQLDTILDFVAGGTEDSVNLHNYGLAGITTFAQLQASGRLATVSGHAELTLNGADKIIFQNVASHASLTAADFTF